MGNKIKAMMFISLILLSACTSDEPKKEGCKKIITVYEYSPRIVGVKYQDHNEEAYKQITSFASHFVCDDATIDAKDFLPLYGGSYPFGEFNSEEYKHYKK